MYWAESERDVTPAHAVALTGKAVVLRLMVHASRPMHAAAIFERAVGELQAVALYAPHAPAGLPNEAKLMAVIISPGMHASRAVAVACSQ